MVICNHVVIIYHFGKSPALKMKALHVWGANYWPSLSLARASLSLMQPLCVSADVMIRVVLFIREHVITY